MLHRNRSNSKKLGAHRSKISILIIKIADTSSLSDILKIKSIQWNYEEEVRYIKTAKDREALSIKIKRIFLGYKLKASEFNFYKKLIQTLDPSIEVVKMKKESLDFGYKE